MSIERSRTAHPVVESPRGLTMGSWAMWITLTAMSTLLGGFVAATLYLHSGQPAWPPSELTRPTPLYAAGMLALTVAGAAAAHRATRQLRAAQRQPATSSLLVSGAALTGAVVVAALDVGAAGFRWDVHAYGSMYWINTLVAALFVGIGVLMVGAVTVQRLVGVVDEDRMLELEVTRGYLWWVVAAAAAMLAVTHLLPDPAAGAQALAEVVR